MFSQEIIIDGFKSYAHRTDVKGYVTARSPVRRCNATGSSEVEGLRAQYIC